jgi:hypothetical protein
MPSYTFKTHVGRDRRVVIELPPDAPEGEVTVRVEQPEPDHSQKRLREFIESLPPGTRTKGEIDGCINELRGN